MNKQLFVVWGTVIILALGVFGFNLGASKHQDVQGAKIEQITLTSTPTPSQAFTPTNSPTPTPTKVPTPTIIIQNNNSGLSNNNYYTNTDGVQVHSSAYSDSIPDGATARCVDGTYSFSLNRRGTCSGHSGVSVWY